MDDISPELLSQVQMAFNHSFYRDETIRQILPKIYNEETTYSDLRVLAERMGEIAGNTLNSTLTAEALPDGTLYYNIAEKVVGNTLNAIHVQVDDLASRYKRA
jgi:hypothetical protein